MLKSFSIGLTLTNGIKIVIFSFTSFAHRIQENLQRLGTGRKTKPKRAFLGKS